MDVNSFLFPIFLALIGALITIRYQEVSNKRDQFKKEFDEVRVTLTDFVSKIKDRENSLNKIILEEFDKQDRAINKVYPQSKWKTESAI